MGSDEVRGGTPQVRHEPAEQQYEIWVAGVRAGLAAYRDEDGATAFTHTKIGDEFGGRGLASTLIAAALSDVAARGGLVLPHCAFVRAYIRKHPDHARLVPADRHAEFGLPAS
jgi:uncharacterized protein